MNGIAIGVFGFRAALTQTGPNEVTAALPHYRNAWDVIQEAQPGADAVLTVDGREVACTITACDPEAWTVTVTVEAT